MTLNLEVGTRVALAMRRGVVTKVSEHGFWMLLDGASDTEFKTWVPVESSWMEERLEPKPPTNLREEITQAINRHSAENGSDTPDFVLAAYLLDCLAAFDRAAKRRDEWHLVNR